MLLVTLLPSNCFHINNSSYLVPTLRYPIPYGTAKRITSSASNQGVAAWCPKNIDLLHRPISPEPNHQFPSKLELPFPSFPSLRCTQQIPNIFVHILYIIYPQAIQLGIKISGLWDQASDKPMGLWTAVDVSDWT